jgi:hypothetical protein
MASDTEQAETAPATANAETKPTKKAHAEGMPQSRPVLSSSRMLAHCGIRPNSGIPTLDLNRR